MDHSMARHFVAQWQRDWNCHDVEALLGHYREGVFFTSPAAAHLLADSEGIIHGKHRLREYWNEGLRRIPDLRFEVVGYYLGVNTLVINYRNQRGELVAEILVFDGDEIVAGHGTYLRVDDDPPGPRLADGPPMSALANQPVFRRA